MTQIKSYPQLNIAALKTKRVTPWRLWLILRHLDQRGEGCVPYSTAEEFYQSSLDLHPRTFRRDLKLALERKWLFDGKSRGKVWLWYAGLEKVARSLAEELDTEPRELVRDHPVLLPLDAFRKIGTLRAHLWASCLTGSQRKLNPITRSELFHRTGVKRRTQIRYCKAANIKVSPNFAFWRIRALADRVIRPVNFVGRRLVGRLFAIFKSHGIVSEDDAGVFFLFEQLGNTHHTGLTVAPRGMLVRLRRKLASEMPVLYASTTGNSRQFFRKPNALLKKSRRESRSYLLVGFVGTDGFWQPHYIPRR